MTEDNHGIFASLVVCTRCQITVLEDVGVCPKCGRPVTRQAALKQRMQASVTRAALAGFFLLAFAPVGMLWGYGQQPAHLEEFLVTVWFVVGLFILFQILCWLTAFLELKRKK